MAAAMHLIDVGRGLPRTSGIVGRASRTRRGAWAAQIRGKGQVVLSFFGDGASKQGAFHETLNIASLWKLPVVFVMENNNYQAYTRSSRRTRTPRRPLAVGEGHSDHRARAVDGGDPSPSTKPCTPAVERALRRRADTRGVHGLPPERPRQHHRAAGVPLHYPEHEAVAVFGNVEEYEAAKRGDPVPASGAARDRRRFPRRRPTRSPRRRRRWTRQVEFGLESPFPAPEKAVEHVYA